MIISVHDSPRTNDFGRTYYAEAPAREPEHDICWIDLSSNWKHSIRDSYRSLINWGRRNLDIHCVSGEQSKEFETYRLFHAMVAGRVTRSEISWNLQWNEIAAGRGELIMARLNGALVSGAMFIDGTKICVYWSGVYDRNQFDKPLAHYTLYLGIEHAQQRGLKWFELGEIPKVSTAPEKEVRIGYFKRGFATHVIPPSVSPLVDNVEQYRRK